MSVIYHQSKKVILLVDKSHVKSMENPKTTLPFSDIYIGGAPSSVLESRYITRIDMSFKHTFVWGASQSETLDLSIIIILIKTEHGFHPNVCGCLIAGLNSQQSLA